MTKEKFDWEFSSKESEKIGHVGKREYLWIGKLEFFFSFLSNISYPL